MIDYGSLINDSKFYKKYLDAIDKTINFEIKEDKKEYNVIVGF